MTLAGEAGSLLCIEEEIRTAIADAKQLWRQSPKHEQAALFSEPGEEASQGEMRPDLSGITNEQFWDRAEQRIYDALEAYAEQAEDRDGFQRRLFADDAAQGFAFIDVCRTRYDVVVMNPPYGAGTAKADPYWQRVFAISEFPKGRKYLISLSFRGKASVRPAQVGGFDVNIVIHGSTAVRGRGDLVAYRWALWKLTAPWTHRTRPPHLGKRCAFSTSSTGPFPSNHSRKTPKGPKIALGNPDRPRVFPRCKADLYAGFLERACNLCTPAGLIGALSDRMFLVLPNFTALRRDCLLARHPLIVLADLWYEVLEGAFNCTEAYVVRANQLAGDSVVMCINLKTASDKGSRLLNACAEPERDPEVYLRSTRRFLAIPEQRYSYWLPDALMSSFEQLPPFEPAAGSVKVGLQTCDDFRFLRCWWEIPQAGQEWGYIRVSQMA